jgi:hypothetical protein
MTVSATFETLEDDGLIGALTHNFSSLKNQKDILKALETAKQVLQGKQAPRRCEEVKYYAEIFVNGQEYKEANSKTDHGDK